MIIYTFRYSGTRLRFCQKDNRDSRTYILPMPLTILPMPEVR